MVHKCHINKGDDQHNNAPQQHFFNEQLNTSKKETPHLVHFQNPHCGHFIGTIKSCVTSITMTLVNQAVNIIKICSKELAVGIADDKCSNKQKLSGKTYLLLI